MKKQAAIGNVWTLHNLREENSISSLLRHVSLDKEGIEILPDWCWALGICNKESLKREQELILSKKSKFSSSTRLKIMELIIK